MKKVLLGLFACLFLTACKTEIDEVKKLPELKKYTITFPDSVENGSITADKITDIEAGEIVTLTISVNEGYKLGSITIVDEDNNNIDLTEVTVDEEYYFEMPNSNVSITAIFNQLQYYSVSIADNLENGSVRTDKTTKILAGETITLTIQPVNNYKLNTLFIIDSENNNISFNHNQNSIYYTFIMPVSNVKVTATFLELPPPTYQIDIASDLFTHGTLSVSKSHNIMEGETIYLTITPDSEYEAGPLFFFIDVNNKYYISNKSNSYTFSMPVGDLVISTIFKYKDGFVKINGGAASFHSYIINNRHICMPDFLLVCDHEVTQKEFTTYCKYDFPTPYETGVGVDDNMPAYYVSWCDAIIYCNLRSIAEGYTPVYSINGETNPAKWDRVEKDENEKYFFVPDGGDFQYTPFLSLVFNKDADGYRLPTEVEWEHIAFSAFGDIPEFKIDNSNNINWSNEENTFWTDGILHKSKEKNSNLIGLYDIPGSLWEMCYDIYGDITESTPDDGPIYTNSFNRVIRGRSWLNELNDCNIQSRDRIYPLAREINIGFRVIRTVSQN
jgi:hypothetical protein